MPAWRDVLTDRQLDDLLDYLQAAVVGTGEPEVPGRTSDRQGAGRYPTWLPHKD
jgi:mono/diheme cytochrome c family protein